VATRPYQRSQERDGRARKEAKTVGAWGAALAAGAVPLEEFNARFDAKIQEAYKQ